MIYGEAQTTLLSNRGHKVGTSSKGGESVGAFAARVESPPLPVLTRLAGQGPTSNVALQRGKPLSLAWQPAARGYKHVTYLELRFSRGERNRVLRCRLNDDGAFQVPAVHLTQARGRVTLSLNRMHRAPFSAAGLEHAELRVSVQDTAILFAR